MGGTAATVVGTNSSDSIAAAQLANIATLSLTAFDSDDVAVLGTTALASASISMGQGDDQVTTGANVSGSSSLIDLGEGADTFTSAHQLSSVNIKGFGGIDTFTLTGATLSNIFLNGNVGGDRINVGGGGGTRVTGATIVGGSEDDIIVVNTTASLTGGRINGQNGDDTIIVTDLGATSTTTMFGGQGNDTLTAGTIAGGFATNTEHVIFSGDLGNDTLTGIAQAVDISGDLLFGGDGNDRLITANGTDGTANSGGGADSLTGGAGADTFVFNDLGNTTAVFANVVGSATTIDAGDTFQLGVNRTAAGFQNFVTNITDFVGGGGNDILDTVNGSNAVTGLGQTIAAGQAAFGQNGSTYKLAGTYNAANSTFTVTADNLGTDTLILLDGSNGAGATVTAANGGYVLLQGTSASTLVAGNFV